MQPILSAFSLLLLASSLSAADKVPPPNPTPPLPSSPVTEAVQSDAPKGKLILPEDETVDSDEGWVLVPVKIDPPGGKAQVDFSASWIFVDRDGKVDPAVKVKVLKLDDGVVVSIPNADGVIFVQAVASIDGVLSGFVPHKITVKRKGGTSTPAVNPLATNPPVVLPPGKKFVTVIYDRATVSQELASLLNSKTLAKAIQDDGSVLRIYDSTSPVLASQKLKPLVDAVGLPTLVIQNGSDGPSRGKVLPDGKALKLPATEAEVLALLGVK